MLRVIDLAVSYGGLRALSGVSLMVSQGQFVAVVGPNGAGKTTLFKAICGIVRPDSGAISFAGDDLLRGSAFSRAHLGIAHVPEGRQVFKTLTVRENLEMGAYTRAGRAAWAHTLERIHALFPILAERAGQLAGTLSGGEQQMLVLAQALISQPRYMLVDELSLGLAPVVVSRLVPVIAGIAGSGTGVLLIEQFATVALGLANHAHIMEGGRIRFSGPASELRANPELLQSAYLLRGSTDQPAAAPPPPAVIPDLFSRTEPGTRAPDRHQRVPVSHVRLTIPAGCSRARW